MKKAKSDSFERKICGLQRILNVNQNPGEVTPAPPFLTNVSLRRKIMSVRHIHARPGEYIAVHRGHGHGGRSGRGSSGGSGTGCLYLLAIIFVIWFIASFWEILVSLAILCAVIWLIWIFRRPIWHAVCWIFSKLANLVQAGYRVLQARRAQKKHTQDATPWPGAPVTSITQNLTPYSSKSADYGKIRQHRR